MRKFLLLLAVTVCFLSESALSQTDHSIGTGTTGNTVTTYPTPLQDYFEGSRAQYLYRASELTAAGMTAGNIVSIKFNVTQLATDQSASATPAWPLEQFQIKLAGTTVATLSATTWEAVPASPNFGPVDYTVTAGINTFTFSTPFYWNGTDNIVVEICNGDPANASFTSWTGNHTVPWTTGLAFNGSHTYREDELGNLCGTSTVTNNGTQTTRPNITFSRVPLSACSGTPNAGNATTSQNPVCSGTNFTLSTSGATFATGLNYQWQSSADGNNWTNIPAATNSTLTTSQTSNTYYRIIFSCGADADTSGQILVGTIICYCPSSANNTVDEEISSVTLNGATNNQNTCVNPAPGPGSIASRYSNFYPLGALTTLIPGRTVDFVVEVGECDAANFNNMVGIWIDFNRDGDFDDAGEKAFAETVAVLGSPRTVSGNITIPSGASPGLTGMRVVLIETATPANLVPCGTYSWGETEDYLVNIIPPTPCSGAPNPGAATAFPTTVCLGQNVNLSNSGATLAVGIDYQWQLSTAGAAGPYTDIAGATNFTYTTAQSVTTWYRFRAVCTNTNDTSYSASVQVNTPPLPNGTYTIDKNAPATTWPGAGAASVFKSFKDAYDAVKCGIGGSVTFNVLPGSGPYNEQLIMNGNIIGANANTKVTFNGNGETITFNTTATERAVIKLKNIKHVVFDSLVIVPTGAANGYGVHLTANADSNIIRKCTVNTNETLTTTNFAGIVISGSETDAIGTGTTTALCDGNEISDNTINGGYYGLTLTATFNGGANGYNKFLRNNVRNFYAYGIYVSGSYNTVIEGNSFSRPTRSNSVATLQAIYFTGQSNTGLINKNRVFNPWGGMPTTTNTFFGISFASGASASSGNDNQVTNNLIFNIGGNGPIAGINNAGANNISYIHNTISLDSANSTATGYTRGFAVTSPATTVLFYNNIISVSRGGNGSKHCIYLSSLLFSCDYNNYYMGATGGTVNAVGFYTQNRTTLAAWQTATGHDANSFSVNPVFVDMSNGLTGYTPGNAAIDNKGLYLGVDTDINNNPRGGSPALPSGKPDMGAHEFVSPACASIPNMSSATTVFPTGTVCQASTVRLNLNIGAYGAGLAFQWQTSTSATGPWTNFGNPKSTPDTIITATSTLYYRVFANCAAAAVTDSSNPVLVTVTPAMPGGTYTIGGSGPAYDPVNPVPGTNFATFNDVKNAMAACGILGAVTFNVVPNSGPYNEQVRFDSIVGASAINTITFNGNGNTIAFSSNNSNERAVIKLNAADHFRFDSLIINATGPNAYGYGVQLINNADSNIFRNCTIVANTTSSSTNFNGIIINSSHTGTTTAGNTWCDYNEFNNNTIIGGNFGMTLVGNTNQLLQDNRITNNKFLEFYSTGIHIAGTFGTLVEGNFISRPTRTGAVGTTYGIHVQNIGNGRLNISKNRITRLFGGNPAATAQQYGIYHNSADATAGNENIVSNNLIYSLDGNGVIYAIANSGSDGVRYYHNTISLDNKLSTSSVATRGFYQVTSAVNIEFINNIVTITRGGSGQKHGIYLETAASEVTSNNNNIYVDGAVAASNFFGRVGATNYATLPAWKTGTGKDALSFDVDPVYVDSANGNYMPGIQTIDNKGVWVQIPTDIVNALRDPSTPDMGAYEFAPPACIQPPVAGTASVTPNSGICLESPITLDLTGHSPLGTLTIRWQSSPDGTNNWTYISPILYSPVYNTVTGSNRFFRAEVICANGAPVYSTVVSVNLNQVVLAGTYTIDNSQPTTWPAPGGTNFNSFTAARDAMLCGITGPVVFNVMPGTTSGVYNEQVRFPYIPNSSAVNTITFQGATTASAATLTYASTAVATNYTLKLDSARYFTFRNMTIAATNATYGRAVDIANTAAFNNIIECTINAPAVTVNNNAVAAIYSNQLKGTNIVLKGNTINNGSMGIYFYGTGAAANLTVDHLIDSNTINGAHSYGINVSFHKRIQLLRNTVNVSSPTFTNTYGIYATECDSAFTIAANKVNISNTTTTIYGLYVNNSDTIPGRRNPINGNIITAGTGNTGSQYGLYINNSPGHDVTNNVISVNTSGTTSYGIYTTNVGLGRYLNNSVNSQSTNGTTTNVAAFFNTNATTDIFIRNNIFSHKGGGRAMSIADASRIYGSDYNMLYTTGTVLVQRGAQTFANLEAWRTTAYWDVTSIVYEPAFISNTDLRPNLTTPDVWAMHGRGVQIKGFTSDINGNYRPDSLTAGVPDLGAYEFYPTALPTVLTPIPNVAPAPGLTQKFMYGTDTVISLKWGSNVPPTVQVRRFSGVQPPHGGPYPSTDSMFFYTQVETPGNKEYDADVRLNYIDSWQGSVPSQYQLGLGRNTGQGSWVVGFTSRVDVSKKVISQTGLDFLDKFTGFVNPYAPPVLPDKDSSNRGRRFWVAYAINQLNAGSTQEMVLYLSAQEPAIVKVKINGTNPPWERTYPVGANQVVQTEFLPKNGPDQAYLPNAGLSDRGISITSDVPIVVYAHATGSASSGAAMLLPVSTWGYEYKTLTTKQDYGAGALSYFYAIAEHDNTVIDVTSTVAVQNAGMTPNVPFRVTLNRGQVYQVVASSQTQDITGSTVKSVPNSDGVCHPVAVFSGSSRTALAATDIDPSFSGCTGSGGDFMMQQNFPATAWGKRYLTAPSSASNNVNSLQPNVYRIAVRDPATVVKKNGTVMTGLINGHYYQYVSNTADYIESDRPIMVAQFLTGACSGAGVGDPEMIYISPIEQGINNVGFYRNDRLNIVQNTLTMIIPTAGLASLVITDGATGSGAPDFVYPHPRNGTSGSLFGVDYSVVVKTWTSAQSQVRVTSDSNFTAITYGLGSVESYGYNAGTLVRNIAATGTIANVPVDTLPPVPSDFNCLGTPFKFRTVLPIKPSELTFKFSTVPNLVPNTDVTLINPVPVDSFIQNRTMYYIFEAPGNHTFTSYGLYPIQVIYKHPDIESCDNTGRDLIYVQVVPSPKANFTINFTGCEGDVAQFAGDSTTSNGITVNYWKWTFHDATNAIGANSSFTYPTPGTYNVNLFTRTKDGCIGDSTKQVVVNARPSVTVVSDSIAVCPGADTTFQVQNPIAGATYNWYDAATGGTLITTGGNFTVGASGTTLTVRNITGPAEYYVEPVSVQGCAGLIRQRVKVDILPLLPQTTVTVTGQTANSVTFSWTPVAGVGYEVSVNGGAFMTPSSGTTGLTHTVTGLGTLDSVNLVVKVLGTIPCQNSISQYQTGCTNSAPQVVNDNLSTCENGSVTFNVQNASSNITYTWYDAATGGNLVFTGNPFSPANLTATTEYWLQHTSAAGCVGTPRTKVTATVLPPLAQAVPVVTSSTATSVTFTWPAVPTATGYQVSVNGGPFVNPSSGATGLTHTVTGLSTLQSVSIVVQAIGVLPCQTSNSASVSGCANSPATVVTDSFAVCTGASATYTVQNPITGFTYRWYTTATGGSPIATGGNFVVSATGNTFTVNNISGAANYWVEQVSAGGCVGTPRTRVAVSVYGPLAQAVIVDPVPAADLTPNSITFRWSAVPGAGSYQVSIDNGPWIPANGNLSHTVTGLAPLQQVSIRVKAIGVITCQESISAAVTARTRPDQIYIPNTFTPNGDGVNDVLKVYGYVIKEVKFLVFNQWGEKIGEVTNNNMGADGSFTVWDGKYKGSYQPVGVYIYVAKIELKDGTVTERKGALNIVR